MAYWWVSQNQTGKHELAGGYLWAPLRDRGGSTPFHWATMGQVRPSDIIFSYIGQSIVAVGVATSEAYSHQQPSDFGRDTWEKDGVRIDVTTTGFPFRFG